MALQNRIGMWFSTLGLLYFVWTRSGPIELEHVTSVP